MRLAKTKNATRNIIFSVIQKVYSLFMPFLMRTLLIYFMGVQYLGINSLFTSILQVLNVTELGIGTAMVFAMYKPIAEDDTDKICRLLRLYKIYYRIVGAVILVAGLAIIPLLPYLISSDSLANLPSDINIYVLYIIDLCSTVLTYWLFAYKNSLFTAHQKNYVATNVQTGTSTAQYVVQILAICLFKNYYIYVIATVVFTAVNNIIVALFARKYYPNYKAKGKLEKNERKSINHKIRDLFTLSLGNAVFSSVDTVIISAFLGLTTLAIYQNYYYIMSSISAFFTVFFTGIKSGIGNSMILESKEKVFKDFKTIVFITCWLVGFCVACFLCLYQPFMKIWVGEELMLGFLSVILICFYFLGLIYQKLLGVYKDAAGIWHKDRYRPLISVIVNICLNLAFVFIWGVNGVLIASIVALLVVNFPWLTYNLFTTVFDKKDLKAFVKDIASYIIVTILTAGFTYLFCYFLHFENDWVILIARLAVCLIIPNLIFLFVYHKKKEFYSSIVLANNMTKGKIKFLNKLVAKQAKS